jgi:H+/Cl- antiporter ClcA
MGGIAMPRILSHVCWSGLIGVGAGLASAVFLITLTMATTQFTMQPWLIWLLPCAGALVAWVYQRFGASANAGNNLILEQLHTRDRAVVPLRMLPLVLLSTLITHLTGGSTGREGTAVQMGGSLAATLARLTAQDARDTRILLMAGISAGFGGVFGTPLAATVFGMEVLAVGGLRYVALLPCLIAAYVADWTVRTLGVPHFHYHIAWIPTLTPLLVGKVIIAAICFAGASMLFVESTHAISQWSRRVFVAPVWRAVAGGLLVIALTLLSGTTAYNGLSLPLLHASFTTAGVVWWAFALKLLFTVVTLGFGYKGGEVTPLFVIGATLGAALAPLLVLPTDLLAALGFVAVFAAAANTPLACILMGVELFGSAPLMLIGICTLVAYTVSGHRSIYTAQRVVTHKYDHDVDPTHHAHLHDIRQQRQWWRHREH